MSQQLRAIILNARDREMTYAITLKTPKPGEQTAHRVRKSLEEEELLVR